MNQPFHVFAAAVERAVTEEVQQHAAQQHAEQQQAEQSSAVAASLNRMVEQTGIRLAASPDLDKAPDPSNGYSLDQKVNASLARMKSFQ